MTEDTRIKIGARLKEAREYLSISQEEAAKATKISRSAVSLVESGQRKLDSVELLALSKLYQRPVSYFTHESVIDDTNEEVVVLARNYEDLSKNDKKELMEFAKFLKHRSKIKS